MSYLSESINMRSLMRECLECGVEFIPNESGEVCCSDRCASVYYGWDDRDEIDNESDYYDEAEYYGTYWG